MYRTLTPHETTYASSTTKRRISRVRKQRSSSRKAKNKKNGKTTNHQPLLENQNRNMYNNREITSIYTSAKTPHNLNFEFTHETINRRNQESEPREKTQKMENLKESMKSNRQKKNNEVQNVLLSDVMREREQGRKIRMNFLLRQSDVFRHFMPEDFTTLTSPYVIILDRSSVFDLKL